MNKRMITAFPRKQFIDRINEFSSFESLNSSRRKVIKNYVYYPESKLVIQ